MRLVLLGFPLSHSVSPAIHNAALEAVGLSEWRYEVMPVEPAKLADAVALLRTVTYAGANVTIPHKTAIVPFLDGLTPWAEAIGAVNTLVKRDGKLIGHNTDAIGLLTDISSLVSIARRAVLILGAGGSARAAVAACVEVGARVRVVARRPEQAQSLLLQFPQSSIELYGWSSTGFLQASDNCALILNTTPLGMTPDVSASPWPHRIPLPPGAFVYDLVYNPAETLFVRQARAAGLRATTGLGMLVEQGALAFQLWTGKEAPRSVMRQAAEIKLLAVPN